MVFFYSVCSLALPGGIFSSTTYTTCKASRGVSTATSRQLQVFLWLHAGSIAGGIYGSTAYMYFVVPVSYATMGGGGWSAGGSDSRNGVVRKMRTTPTQEACAQEGRGTVIKMIPFPPRAPQDG